MVIDCTSCSRRFNLNKNLLKPTGSIVRCSKCGNIFPAYPAHNSRILTPALESDGIAKDVDQSESTNSSFEKRRHPRVAVSVPVICDALNLEGNPCDIHIGLIKEVSKAGLAVELFSSPTSERLLVSIIDAENRDVQIKAEVVHSKTHSLMIWMGLSLTGPPMETNHFVTHVMKNHQISCSRYRQVQL